MSSNRHPATPAAAAAAGAAQDHQAVTRRAPLPTRRRRNPSKTPVIRRTAADGEPAPPRHLRSLPGHPIGASEDPSYSRAIATISPQAGAASEARSCGRAGKPRSADLGRDRKSAASRTDHGGFKAVKKWRFNPKSAPASPSRASYLFTRFQVNRGDACARPQSSAASDRRHRQRRALQQMGVDHSSNFDG